YNETDGAQGALVVSTNSSFGVDLGQPVNFPIWCGMYDELGAEGILSATATANANFNVDTQGDIPTACPSPYMIAVTNTTRTDTKASGAGYGVTTIDLGAPGTSILSTTPGNAYGNSTGTSMATPHVAGAVALLVSGLSSARFQAYLDAPGPVALALKQDILDGTDNININTVTRGRLNLFKALLEALEDDPGSRVVTGTETLDGGTLTGQNVYVLPGGVLTLSGTITLQADAAGAPSFIYVAGRIQGDADLLTSGGSGLVMRSSGVSCLPLFADRSAAGTPTGATWATAYTDLQAAITASQAVAACTDGRTVRVAQGVYRPSTSDRTVSFRPGARTRLVGGFPTGGSLLTGRAPALYPTVLSGDMGGDDAVDAAGVTRTPGSIVGNNSHHVVWIENAADALTLDGFVVTGGQANGTLPHTRGGGLYHAATTSGAVSRPQLLNLTFAGNTATAEGGGLYSTAVSGAEASPRLTGVAFTANATVTKGGGMFNGSVVGGTARPVFLNVAFRGNTAGTGGGGLFDQGFGTSASTLTNVLFVGNGGGYGGGLVLEGAPAITFSGATFVGNVSGGGPGAVGTVGAPQLAFRNSVFWDNGPVPTITFDAGTVSFASTLAEGGIPAGVPPSGVHITRNPLLARMPSPGGDGNWGTADDDYGDLRLTGGSPGVDVGDGALVPAGVTTDLAGSPRLADGDLDGTTTVDLGAYETAVAAYAATVLDGQAGWRMLSAPLAGLTVDGLAARNLVQGIPGYYPAAQVNLYTGYDGSAFPAPTSGATALALGVGFIWYLYDETVDPGGASEGYALPMTLALGGAAPPSEVVVPLHEAGTGWNLVGNPFPFTLGLADLPDWAEEGALASAVGQVWDPNAGSGGSYVLTTTLGNELEAWTGVFVQNDDAARLRIPASAAVPEGATAAPFVAFELAGETPGGAPLVDRSLVAVFPEGALPTWDVNDAGKLTPPGERFVIAAFTGERDGTPVMQAQTSHAATVGAFDLHVQVAAVGADGTLTLTWPRLDVPAAWDLTLHDAVTGAAVDLRAASSYTFEVVPETARAGASGVPSASTWSGNGSLRFVLNVAPSGVVATEPGVPTAFALGAAQPNPTRGAALVTMALPTATPVHVAVYDALGREVAVLADGERPAGRHALRLEAGSLATGVYVVRMTAGDFVGVQRLTVVR
ncbi:MAG TPA: S8 family peptidase, partial [Rhodothermales bacterium]|nr:S8 family peptidase [Rhodothermales bacterium]